MVVGTEGFAARNPSLPEGDSNSSIDTFENFADSSASREPTLAHSASTWAASPLAATRRAPTTSAFEPPAVATKADVPRIEPLRADSSSGVIADEKPHPKSRNRPAAIVAVVNDPPDPTAKSGRPERRMIFFREWFDRNSACPAVRLLQLTDFLDKWPSHFFSFLQSVQRGTDTPKRSAQHNGELSLPVEST